MLFSEGQGYSTWILSTPEGDFTKSVYEEDGHSVTFFVDPGSTRIWAYWSSEVWLEEVFVFLLGPVLGRVLRQRGFPCLHANAVLINGGAVLIAGRKGAGKSTTTAFLADSGHALISDDISALEIKNGRVHVHPGIPRIRLQRGAALRLCAEEGLVPIWQRGRNRPDKVYLDLEKNGYSFSSDSCPLKCIYILQPRSKELEAICIEDVPASSRLISLLTNTYADHQLSKKSRAHEFELLGNVVSNIPIRNVTMPHNLETLPEACKVLVRDAAGI